MSLRVVIALALAAAPLPAAAEVAASSEAGFASHNEVLVTPGPQVAWDALVTPAEWWNGEHTYSGEPANLSIELVPGGCFCERVPESGGAIEHMRVVNLAPGSTLRMTGALGPLQSEAVTGVLTMTLTPDGEKTRIAWDYVVGGYARMPLAELAPLVDQVIGEQLLRLAARLGSKVDPAPRRGL
jgi:uncharacterized protein YndB with AHSA1/START domain